MRTISYWIQRADFSSTDHPALDSASAVEMLKTHDWASEWRLLRELEAAGLEACPPGIGFMDGQGGILHVCPSDDGPALVHYQFEQQQRWMGLIPYKASWVRTNLAAEWSQLPEFVRRFYADDHVWLVSHTTIEV